MTEAFEIPGILASIAEGAITLAGFSAVFRAFSGAHDPDGYSWIRLSIVIEGSLVTALCCYLPIGLIAMGVAEQQAWKIVGLLLATWGIFRLSVPAFRILGQPGPLPALFWGAVPQGFFSVLVNIVNATGLMPVDAYAAYLFAVILLLGNVGTIFVAQFRVEHLHHDRERSSDAKRRES